MPEGKQKGIKGGKGRTKGKGAKKAAERASAAAENAEMLRTCQKFIRIYQSCCAASASAPSQTICRDMKLCVENERPLKKFILDLPSPVSVSSANPGPRPPPGASADKSQAPDFPRTFPTSAPTTCSGADGLADEGPLLQPLVDTWKELRYRWIACLHVWSLHLGDEAVVSLARFIESPLGPNLKVLELRDTKLSSWAITRLTRCLAASQLTVINFDYNRFLPPDVGCLCVKLQTCATLHSLSLDYCRLEESSAEHLGPLIVSTQIKHLSLAGNSLLCEGATALLQALALVCESSTAAFPPLARLSLQDNGIDCSGPQGMFGPVSFIRTLKRWLLCSPLAEEVNLDDNWVGEAAGRELVSVLQLRKDAGLPTISLKTTTRLSEEVYSSIVELATPGKTKRKKKRHKK